MSNYKLNGRDVEIDYIEFEVGEGACCIEARFADTGEALTDTELEAFNEGYADELYQEVYEHTASAAYDRAKDQRKYGDE